MKKFIYIFFIILVVFFLFSYLQLINNAGSKLLRFKNNVIISTSNDIETELNDDIEKQLADIDFSEIDNILKGIDDGNGYLKDYSFIGIVKKFIDGENSDLYSNFLAFVVNLLFGDIISYIPYFAICIAICVLYSLLSQFSSNKDKSVMGIVHLACFGSVAVIVFKIVIQVIMQVSNVILSLQGQMEIIFPILLTLISSIGGIVTTSSFQPILAILCSGISKLFSYILLPIIIFCLIFCVIGNLSKNIKLEKSAKFCSSLFNYIIGTVFTIFIAFLAIKGLTASSIDSISLKTAKYALKSYIPILGSYLSDGIGIILASSVLIKNAVGATGLILLIATVISPIIKVMIISLLLKLVSAILEPICDDKTSNFLFGTAKTLNMLNICLIAVGFMYLISVSILMCSSNVI